MYVVLEGSDFSGKSTQIKELKAVFESMDVPVLVVREPEEPHRTEVFKVDYKKSPREAYLSAFHMTASRLALRKHVEEWLAEHPGGLVLADRNYISSVVYQGLTSALKFGQEAKHVTDLIRSSMDVVLHPDVLFILDPVSGATRPESENNAYDDIDPEEWLRRYNTVAKVYRGDHNACDPETVAVIQKCIGDHRPGKVFSVADSIVNLRTGFMRDQILDNYTIRKDETVIKVRIDRGDRKPGATIQSVLERI